MKTILYAQLQILGEEENKKEREMTDRILIILLYKQ